MNLGKHVKEFHKAEKLMKQKDKEEIIASAIKHASTILYSAFKTCDMKLGINAILKNADGEQFIMNFGKVDINEKLTKL